MTFLLKSQSLVLILVGIFIFYGVFAWTHSGFDNAQDRSTNLSDSVVKCSEIKVNFVDRQENRTHHTVFFQLNREVEALMFFFKGSRNATATVRDIDTNEIRSATAKVVNVTEVDTAVKKCEEIQS